MIKISEKEFKLNHNDQVNYLIAKRIIEYIIKTKSNNLKQISKALHLTSRKTNMILNRLTNQGFIIRKCGGWGLKKQNKLMPKDINSVLEIFIREKVSRKSKAL